MRFLFFLFCTLAGYASQVPDFHNLNNTKNAVIFMSSKRSGSNLVSGSLLAITRKPISWLEWGYRVFEPGSKFRAHLSYNRLGLPLVSEEPLLYRLHYDFEKIKKIPPATNRLIFVTRNPKELIFREHYPDPSSFDFSFAEEFLHNYLKAFEIYDRWQPENRFLVFYEDFIASGDEILLQLLSFMGEKPLFFDDYLMHRQEYLNTLLTSYGIQHARKRGGASCRNGPQEIYYSKEIARETLLQIDTYIKSKAPLIWERYLKRFRTD